MEKICIIIPCKNEEDRIKACLDGVLSFERPENVNLEIFVYDGGSDDRTREIVDEMSGLHPEIKLRDNPDVYQGCAVNKAVQESTADYFLWLGAHTEFPVDYVKLCYDTIKRSGADVVGGVCITLFGGEGYGAKLVQALTTHKFGVGDSSFRLGGEEGPVDTVAYALFKSELFKKIGYLDERLVRAQDYEFNRRIKESGGQIWLNPNITCEYHNMPTLLGFYKKQVVLEAPYNAYMWYLAPYSFTLRHAISAVFATGVLGGAVIGCLTPWIGIPYCVVMALYFVAALASSIQQAIRYKNVAHVVCLPVSFFLYHFLHGLGVLAGLLMLLLRAAPVQKVQEPWPGAMRKRAWPAVDMSSE